MLAFNSIFLLLSLLLVGCDLTGKSTGANDGLLSGRTDVRGLLLSDGRLKGTGQFVSGESLGQVRGSKSFELQFVLEEGGSLTLTTYSNSSLLDGVGVEFSRTGNKLSARFFGQGVELSIADRLLDWDATQKIHLLLDVHNNHDDAAHLLLWPYLGDASGTYGPQNALINTDFFQLPVELDGYDFPDWLDMSVKGNGAFWGLDLRDAEVLIYRVGESRDNS